MKNYPVILILILVLFGGCEDDIFPPLEETAPQIVVDAWINNKPETQYVYLNRSQPYYDSSFPQGIAGASVRITDNDGKQFDFTEGTTAGVYEWTPNATDTVFGELGNVYTLSISVQNTNISAAATMNRVPEIDSVIFKFEEEDAFFPEGYYGEFYASDPIGSGDTYWIKSYKNGSYLNKPEEINIAFDAGFSEGGNIDGLVFIPPIREAVNPFELDEDDEFIVPYEPGDSLFVEIYSITNEAFYFLNEMSIQINRPGGFGEFFAVPLANLPTNLETDGEDVIGFFNVSAVSGMGAKLEE